MTVSETSSHGTASRAKRLSRQTMSGQVADDLRRRILSGELPEGMQLKQEQLAAEFGISKVPVREALHQLEAEGFIVQHFHRGATVAGLSPVQVMQLFEFRAEIEVWLLGLGMRSATDADLAEIKRVAKLMESSEDPAEYPQLNWQFHEAMYLPAKRDYALDVIRKIHHQLDRYVRLQFTLATHKERVMREHTELLKLYAARKLQAKASLRQHILRAAEELSKQLVSNSRSSAKSSD